MKCTAEAPVIMLGCQRSGTTLMARILGAHPNAGFGSELGVIRFALIWFRGQCRSKAAFRNLRMVEFLHAFRRVGGEQGPEPHRAIFANVEQVLSRYLRDGSLERWADSGDVDALIRSLCFDAHTLNLPRPLLWGDKYPEYIFALDEIEAVFPSARYIFLHRHPYDVMESLFRHRNTRRGFAGSLRFNMADCRDQWIGWNEIWNQAKEGIDPERRIEVPFEALVGVAERTLERVSEFLDVPLLESPELRRLISGIDSAQIGKWRSMPNARLVAGCPRTDRFEEMCLELDYRLDTEGGFVVSGEEQEPKHEPAPAKPPQPLPVPPPPSDELCEVAGEERGAPPTPLPPPPEALCSPSPSTNRSRASERSHPRTRLLVIGLDGMTPNLLFEELARLENFKTLIEGGVHGELASVSPPMSGCAWPSFFTGLEPNRHGFDENQRRFEDMSYADVRVPKLWDYLNRAGISTGFHNMPLAYQMSAMRGYIVPGRFAPLQRMTPEVRGTLQGYRAHPRIAPQSTPEFLREQWETDRQCVHYWEKLVREHPTDLATIVLYTSDNVGHWFWDDPSALHDSYGLLDSLVGRIMNSVEADNVIIMSDHGMRGKEEPGTEEFQRVLSDKGETVHHEMQGWHQKNGIFIASGSSFAPSENQRPMSLIDLTPVMLRLFGVVPPETAQFDGSAPDWLFRDAAVQMAVGD
ncbi:MAG: hypothetical protein CME06_14335 [Gemmatimonadetes bacterium]|nr:hypothetical protein [Gemmatimonadota bacterium]